MKNKRKILSTKMLLVSSYNIDVDEYSVDISLDDYNDILIGDNFVAFIIIIIIIIKFFSSFPLFQLT